MASTDLDRTHARLIIELTGAAGQHGTADAAAEALGDGETQARLRAALLAFATHRAPTGSTCPSEAARVVGAGDWRTLMPDTRDVAADLARQGLVEITQRGVTLDPDAPWRGPIRVRLARP